jgi:hypothetical protein
MKLKRPPSNHVCSRAWNAPSISLSLDGTTRLVAFVELLIIIDKRVKVTKAARKQQCKTKTPLRKKGSPLTAGSFILVHTNLVFLNNFSSLYNTTHQKNVATTTLMR